MRYLTALMLRKKRGRERQKERGICYQVFKSASSPGFLLPDWLFYVDLVKGMDQRGMITYFCIELEKI